MRYLFAQISLPFVFGVLVLADTHLLHLLPLPPQFGFMPAMAAVLFGFYAPEALSAERRRQARQAAPAGAARRARPDGDLRRGRAQPRRHPGARIARARPTPGPSSPRNSASPRPS